MLIQLVKAEILCHLLPLGRGCCSADSEGHNGNSLKMSMWRYFSLFRIVTVPNGVLQNLLHTSVVWCSVVWRPWPAAEHHTAAPSSPEREANLEIRKSRLLFSAEFFLFLLYLRSHNKLANPKTFEWLPFPLKSIRLYEFKWKSIRYNLTTTFASTYTVLGQ